ncbi:UDP-glycosyltransferase UGT5-like [Zerene cesonia]|uniref:UDP-glycosyltransferase UGT5-like n=1 Tax=Zerene cesonia TaxID=33412 RepID=UPI0018E565E9|nr:UDP-glycosyltransferase UGT5-like [Zerene cesonia]XP_038217978.1 UDP-glycosyltransferase UGT5-like [Zerene cesonia]XP_038217979.1 UDP-glycosyltransferase UGT5-like [Zerene cesonia]
MCGLVRVVCFLILFFDYQTNAANILAVFPSPSLSHQVIFQPLTKELASRGHNLTVITTDPVFTKDNISNLREIDVHDVSYNIWKDDFIEQERFGEKSSVFNQLINAKSFMVNVTTLQLEVDEVKSLINNEDIQFDLLLIEAWTRHALIYSHIFKAPVILVSSFGMMLGNEENVGAPIHPILYSMVFQQRLYNLTFWEKFDALYRDWWCRTQWVSGEVEEIHHYRKLLGRYIPHYKELRNNVDMLFLNSHPVWMNNQPFPPNVISIWGIHKKPEKPLPKDLQDFLDSSKHGVIYISFGTNAPSCYLPSHFIQLLIRVFSKLPYDVLWKWEKDVLPGKSENIRISKWLPQSDLLKHSKIKLFITQGGLQSTDEAITAGVPVIGIPMLGDQWYNAEKFAHHGIGIKLDMETINDKELEAAIDNVINDRSYRDNVIRLRSVMRDQPESGLQRAVWWTEYVLRHGGAKHLRSPAANMPWTEYYEIDFLLKLLLIACSFIVASFIVFYSISKLVFDNVNQKRKTL